MNRHLNTHLRKGEDTMSMKQLKHYSSLTSDLDVRERYRNVKQECSKKPKGIWYAVGDLWMDWVKNAMPSILDRLTVLYNADISECNILKLTNIEELVDFSIEFMDTSDFYSHGIRRIDWELVAKYYDGIEVSNWKLGDGLEEGVLWVDSWDFASGCVWNVDKIILKKVGG